MPSSVSANMLTEMRGQGRIFPVLELTLGTTIYLFAEDPIASASQGLYKPYVTSWSGFSRTANAADFSLELPSPEVSVFDAERVLQKAIGGPQKARIRNSAVRCVWRSNFVSASDHHVFFSGVVKDYALSGDRTWSFTLSPNVEILQAHPKIPFLTSVDFPTAPPKMLGKPLWIVYGKLASAGITGATGMVKALPATVDSNGDAVDWVLSYGQMTIQRLWRPISNVMTEDTSNWAFYPLERGLHRYQMARYTGGGTKPLPDDDVRVDCQGLFAAAPVSGTTTPFENPASCIRNFLAHFCYGDGDVRAGKAWASESGKPIATAVFDAAETYFDQRRHVMAKVIHADELAIDVLNAWCDSFNAAPFWTDEWKVGAIPEDESEIAIHPANSFISQYRRETLSELRMDTSRGRPVTEILVNYLLDEAEGDLTISSKVADPSIANVVSETFDLSYGDKSLVDLP